MAYPEPFTDRIEIRPLYRERFCVAFPIVDVDQHSLHRVVENLAIVDQLGDESDRAHLGHQRGIDNPLVLEQPSRTPQVKAPSAPPPCGARLISLVSTVGAGIQSGLVCRSLRCRPFWLLRVVAPALSKLRRSFTKKCTALDWVEMPTSYNAGVRRLSPLARS